MGLYDTTLESSTPATPTAGRSVLYPKSDGKWYYKTAAGDEVELLDSASIALNSGAGLKCYLRPSFNHGWGDIYRSGLDWWSRNPQHGGPWGGTLLDTATGILYKTEFASSNIDAPTLVTTADAAARTYSSIGFKVAETDTMAAVWVKMYKVGNPTNDMVAYIYNNSGGSPSTLVTNGTSTGVNGKRFFADVEGNWVRFSFATPPSLTKGTQYHIVLKSSGAVDASNYWGIKAINPVIYPHGFFNYGDATPSWTQYTTIGLAFLIEMSSSAQILQDSGTFDGKLVFGGSGTSGTLNLSRGLCSNVPLHELMDPAESTYYEVWDSLTKDTTFFDAGCGEDHDRIVVRCNAFTGYVSVNVYAQDGTLHTVTVAVDVSSGEHSIGWYVRAKNDGVDRIDVIVDDTEASSTGLSLSFDPTFGLLGTLWRGGGFALAPTDTQKLTMTVLPSAASPAWTWTGTGTESACMSIQNNRLRQNKNGYTSTQTGYYARSSLSLSNTNGHSTRVKMRVVSDNNAQSSYAIGIQIADGTKYYRYPLHEYFMYSDVGTALGYVQADLKQYAFTLHAAIKGSDGLTFINRKLVMDSTGAVTSTTGSNEIWFGDTDNTAGENSDVDYAYFAYYNTAWNPPQFTSGALNEFAIWQGNAKALWPLLYNGGTRISVMDLLRLNENYLDKSSKRDIPVATGITNSPSTASASNVLLAEMSIFAITADAEIEVNTSAYTGTNNTDNILASYVDGAPAPVTSPYAVHERGGTTTTANTTAVTLAIKSKFKGLLGLHKFEGRFHCTGTMVAWNARRSMSIKGQL